MTDAPLGAPPVTASGDRVAGFISKDGTMSLYRTIYTSRPFGFDEGILSGILMDARRANSRDDVTGALICRADIYIQWLEGPEEQVRKVLARIERDDRHLEVKVHVAETVPARRFGDWAMLHDPAATWIWSQREVADGAVERATPEEVRGFFDRLPDGRAAVDAGRRSGTCPAARSEH